MQRRTSARPTKVRGSYRECTVALCIPCWANPFRWEYRSSNNIQVNNASIGIIRCGQLWCYSCWRITDKWISKVQFRCPREMLHCRNVNTYSTNLHALAIISPVHYVKYYIIYVFSILQFSKLLSHLHNVTDMKWIGRSEWSWRICMYECVIKQRGAGSKKEY